MKKSKKEVMDLILKVNKSMMVDIEEAVSLNNASSVNVMENAKAKLIKDQAGETPLDEPVFNIVCETYDKYIAHFRNKKYNILKS